MRRTKQIRHAGELPEPPKERSGPIVPVLAFAGITVAVMQTLLVPVIKDLPVLLSTDPANATWVMTATLLAGAVSTPIMGRLGDLYGKRRMLLASLAVMVVGSLICASTDDLVVMITGRALQGFAMGIRGSGALLPVRTARGARPGNPRFRCPRARTDSIAACRTTTAFPPPAAPGPFSWPPRWPRSA
ncbi:hypothetical protein SMICM17S_04123 [Streptomyces microflavus]